MSFLKSKQAPWVMWGILCAFFAYQFVIRVSLGVMTTDIMGHFAIDATQFGMIASIYYLGYATMQVPIGILLDRFGPRYIATFCITLCFLGILLFVTAGEWTTALVGRLLIGMGSSGAFISTSKIARSWFPEGVFTRMVGITVTLGILGAINGGGPVAKSLEYFSWQTVMYTFATVAAVLAILCYTVVRNPLHFKTEETQSGSLLSGFFQVLKMRSIVSIAIFGALMGGPLYVFADTISTPFFETAYGWSRTDAAGIASVIYIGMCFGSPILAYVSEKFQNDKMLIVISAATMAACLGIVLFMPGLPYEVVAALMFTMGFFSAYQVLVFVLVARLTSPAISGVVIGFTNMINMYMGSFLVQLCSWGLDFFRSMRVEEALVYSGEDYRYAAAIVCITLTIGAIGLGFTKLKKSR